MCFSTLCYALISVIDEGKRGTLAHYLSNDIALFDASFLMLPVYVVDSCADLILSRVLIAIDRL